MAIAHQRVGCELVLKPLLGADTNHGSVFPNDNLPDEQSFDKWMRQWDVWHSLHLCHIENPEIGAPLAKLE
jgi:hypothetical protein